MTLATPSSEACPPTKQRGYPRPPPVVPAEAGTQRKTKHAANHTPAYSHVIPAGPAPYPDTGAGTQNPGTKGRGIPPIIPADPLSLDGRGLG